MRADSPRRFRGSEEDRAMEDCSRIGSRSGCISTSACKWCRSDAVDDFCFSNFEAARLPSQIVSCDSIQERAQLHVADGGELSIIEAKLSWIVHIVAALLKVKQCSGCSKLSMPS